ncbi:MAG TPA: hypothetical protein PLU10_00985 [Chitinophagaceae bacterium]|nr:hypothetical protein [Chitinophagaceae bacterium]
MAARQQFQITIPSACHQNFEAMPQTERGRYCALCERDIIDFTCMSDEELIDFLSLKHFKISCGMFTRDQLNRNYSIEKPRPFFRFPTLNKWVAAFFLLPLNMPYGVAQSTNQLSATQQALPSTYDTLIRLQGKLVNNDTTHGVSNIEITLLDTNQVVLQSTLTDQLGKFIFEINPGMIQDSIQLRAKPSPNFHVEPISLSLSHYVAYNPPIILTMMPMVNLPVVNVITVSPYLETHVTGGVPMISYDNNLVSNIPYSVSFNKRKSTYYKKKHQHKKKSK